MNAIYFPNLWVSRFVCSPFPHPISDTPRKKQDTNLRIILVFLFYPAVYSYCEGMFNKLPSQDPLLSALITSVFRLPFPLRGNYSPFAGSRRPTTPPAPTRGCLIETSTRVLPLQRSRVSFIVSSRFFSVDTFSLGFPFTLRRSSSFCVARTLRVALPTVNKSKREDLDCGLRGVSCEKTKNLNVEAKTNFDQKFNVLTREHRKQSLSADVFIAESLKKSCKWRLRQICNNKIVWS